MIPAIGVMIGCYIITRMTETLLPESEEWTRWVVGVLAVVTILVTGFMMADLITGSQSATSNMGAYPNFQLP
jgi:formate hydrogenlyase subunit 3/multisubunit Na+/H+ antiporter MnhD subunit